jgi:Tol biopolymer transport system component
VKTRVALAVLAALAVALPAAAAETFPNVEIYRVVPGGKARNVTANPALDTSPSPSPDGGRIAFVSTRDGRPDLYVMPAAGGAAKRLTTSPFQDQVVAWNDAGTTTIAWAPNGTRIAFDTQNATFPSDCQTNCVVWSVYVANADGTGPQLVASQARSPAWSADGSLLAYENDVTPYGESESVGIARPDGSGMHSVAGFNPYSFEGPVWSPTRKELAFQANNGVYTVRADGSAKHRLALGASPAWAPDGASLAFVRAGSVFRARRTGSAPRRLTRAGYAFFPVWSPNGRSIAVLTGTQNGPTQVGLVPAAGGILRRLTSFPRGTGFDGAGPVWARRAGGILFSLRPPG